MCLDQEFLYAKLINILLKTLTAFSGHGALLCLKVFHEPNCPLVLGVGQHIQSSRVIALIVRPRSRNELFMLCFINEPFLVRRPFGCLGVFHVREVVLSVLVQGEAGAVGARSWNVRLNVHN